MLVTFPESKTNKDQRKKVNLLSKIAYFVVPRSHLKKKRKERQLRSCSKVKKNKNQKKNHLPELPLLKNKEKGMLEAFLNEKGKKKPIILLPFRPFAPFRSPRGHSYKKERKKNVRNVLRETHPIHSLPQSLIHLLVSFSRDSEVQ